MTTPIPNKLHILFAMAMEDIEEARNNPKKGIDLADWGRQEGEICVACFAGHHLKNRYPGSVGINSEGYFNFDEIQGRHLSIAFVLNDVRHNEFNHVTGFYNQCGDPRDTEKLEELERVGALPRISGYMGRSLNIDDVWLQFKSEMSALIQFLKEKNL